MPFAIKGDRVLLNMLPFACKGHCFWTAMPSFNCEEIEIYINMLLFAYTSVIFICLPAFSSFILFCKIPGQLGSNHSRRAGNKSGYPEKLQELVPNFKKTVTMFFTFQLLNTCKPAILKICFIIT